MSSRPDNTDTQDKAGATVSLPIVEARGPGAIRPSRMGKRRAAVLIAVHVVIVIHVIQWLVMGMTISPIEPSESMQTLENGVVNAGFIFFCLAILATLILGRFVCGWGCHVIALQDLCTWMMRRLGVNPKPFRSRLLVFAPLALGLYMFAWPTFKRVALKPLLASMNVSYPVWLKDVADLPGFTSELVVVDFWATFAAWYIAIPFLLVCGFATVYFLGSKGFCTYGCPYGGLFAPADMVATVRVRVTDACKGCGHCTAVCSSNVRVHEEVRDYGMVVDPGCMKCLDCVSVCPNDALYVGLGRPALLAPLRSNEAKASHKKAKQSKQKRYDMSLVEEAIFTVVMVALFFAYRGLLDAVPLLMAVGMAGIGTVLIFKLWKLVRVPSVRLQNLQLKVKGAIRPAGFFFALLALVAAAGALWGGQTRWSRWQADLAYATLDVPAQIAMRPEYVASETTMRRAQRAMELYRRTDAFKSGGLGWSLNADLLARLAYLDLLLGRFDEAKADLYGVIEKGNPKDAIVFQLAGIMQAAGATQKEILEVYEDALQRHPTLNGVRSALAQNAVMTGRPDDAAALWQEALDKSPHDVELLLACAGHELSTANHESAALRVAQAQKALQDRRHQDPGLSLRIAEMLMVLGQAEQAAALVDQVLGESQVHGSLLLNCARLQARLGKLQEAKKTIERALADENARAGVFTSAGTLLFEIGEPDRGGESYREAAEHLDDQPWDTAALGSTFLQMGFNFGVQGLVDQGVELVARASEEMPGSATLRHDFAMALAAVGRGDEALKQMEEAVRLGGESPFLTGRLQELRRQLGGPTGGENG